MKLLVPYPFPTTGEAMATGAYDEIYVQSWQDTLKQCQKLERSDRVRALKVKSLQDFRDELKKLMIEYPDDQSKKAMTLIVPTLDHYQAFAQNFVDMMDNPVDVSLMWGLLFLVFKVALGCVAKAPPRPLSRIGVWLEKIGHKLRASNECSIEATSESAKKVRGDALEVNKEIVLLWLAVISTFRNQKVVGDDDEELLLIRCQSDKGEPSVRLDESAWETLTKMYESAYKNIDDAVKRIEKVAEMAEKQAQRLEQMTMIQHFMSFEIQKQEEANLPCNNLPVAENKRFFGREDLLLRVEQHLMPTDTDSQLSSVALYGLGGIGKTQIALAYAYSKLSKLDAIFWISAEDEYSVQQSFSHVALNSLKLPQAHAQAYQENMLLVLDWLQKTDKKWLLIFDNVDNHDVISNCWPVSKHGAVLVTTRDVVVASLPIDTGLEITEFEPDQGAKFLLQMTPKRRQQDEEFKSAEEISRHLGGLPLALNQMAALINARNSSMKDFCAMYKKYEQRLHSQKKSGFKYLGYVHGLDTVWDLSFKDLSVDARACLGVLSFLSADSAPLEVFTAEKPDKFPQCLAFCEDELSLEDALDELTHHALVRKNITQGTFRIHRLVQVEYRARMENPQVDFEAATKLLLDKFPSQRESKYDDEEWLIYERYIPQVLALMRNYNESQSKARPLQPNRDFVDLLAQAVNAVHDNDTANISPGLLSTADSAWQKCPDGQKDRLLWALLKTLECRYHQYTAEWALAVEEAQEGLSIRLELLHPEDFLISLSYSTLGMALGAQERYDEGLGWLLKAGKVLDGPAGDVPSKKMVWRFNTSRNYYCMGRFDEAEELLDAALAEADKAKSWYQQIYAHLTFASLRTRQNRLDEARSHVDKAQSILMTAGSIARFSWLSSYCSYRAGDVAMRQGRVQNAIEETERAVAIGKLTKAPTSVLARCTHAYSKALSMDGSRQEESGVQRKQARRLRSEIPGGGGDLDDEDDAAFERLVKMDQR